MKITLIAAVAENGVIGRKMALPWRLAADLKHFRQTTTGHPVIMGRRTYDSIGKALPERRNIVISRNPQWLAPGCEHACSLPAALTAAAPADNVFVIGGEQIYRLALPIATHLQITEVGISVADGDAFFPRIESAQWQEIDRQPTAATDTTPGYAFVLYERATADPQ